MTALNQLFAKPQPRTGEMKLVDKPGREHWRMKRYALHAGFNQAQFNQLMNNPDLYQFAEQAQHEWRTEQALRRRRGLKYDDNDRVHLAVAGRRLEELTRLLAGGRPVDVPDREGRTPLFYAVMDGDEEIAEILVHHGADVNSHDLYAETPLHFAARENHASLAEFLLANGARVDAQDIDGNTPLLRCALDSHGNCRLAKLLVDAGANTSFRNHYGVSPIDLAGHALDW
ncbi:MAG: ankyrin repeat domain-containing protein [Fimbriimonadaceae bacterium]